MNLTAADCARIGNLKIRELKDEFKQLAANGKLPLAITFIDHFPDDDSFLEPGMMGYLSGVDLVKVFDDGSALCQLHCYFGDHFDHNKKMFKKVFNNNFGKPTLTALDKNTYSEYENFQVDGGLVLSDYIKINR